MTHKQQRVQTALLGAILAAGLLVCAHAAAAPVELLTNGGFERGEWEWSSVWGHYGHTVVQDDSYSGDSSMYFSKSGAIKSLRYTYNGGPVRVSGWYKMRDVKQGKKPWYRLWICVSYFDADGKGLGHVDYQFDDGTSDWKRLDKTAQGYKNAKFLELSVALHNCTGEMWVDDLQIEADALLDWPTWKFTRKPYYTSHIQPTPVECEYGEEVSIYDGALNANTVRVHLGNAPCRGAAFGADQMAFRLSACERYLRFHPNPTVKGERVRVYLGRLTDSHIRRAARRIKVDLPALPPQGHVVRMVKRGDTRHIVAAGTDDKGVFYAAASLVQMMGLSDGTLVLRTFDLLDEPAFTYRAGGDYGAISDDLLAQIALSKCSTYSVQHRSWWRLAGPEVPGVKGRPPFRVGMERMGRFVERTGVMDLMLLLHIYVPGGRPLDQTGAVFDITDDADIEDLTRRLRWLYDTGVKIQMVCVDDYVDVANEAYDCKTQAERDRFGSIGKAHGYLMRRLWDALRPTCPDLKLSIVAGPYSLSHLGSQVTVKAGRQYLRDMAREMPQEVAVVWTGPRITSPTISREDWQEYSRLVLGLPLYIWDNNQGRLPIPKYDVSFYKGIENDSAWGLMYQNAHFAGWPHTMVSHLAANDYMWNPAAYDVEASHREAVAKAFGEVSYEDVRTVNEGHELARRMIRGGEFDEARLLATVKGVYEAIDRLEALGVPTSVPRRQMSAAGVVPTIATRLEQLPRVIVPKTSASPVIDGKLDDAAWDGAVKLAPFAHYRDTESTKFEGKLHASHARLTYDAEALYIACSLQHGDIALRSHGYEGRRDAPIYFESDALEVFLMPASHGGNYAHLAVDHTNTVFDEMRGAGGANWNGDWQSAVSKTDGVWHVELRVPFATLGTQTPAEGDVWRANFCRAFAQEPNQFSCWAPIYGSFHNWPFYGKLEFD